MISFKKYVSLIEEDDDVAKLEPKALKWLKGKYGDLYDFKFIKGMEMDGNDCKSYSVSVDGDNFKLHLRKFKSGVDVKAKDVVGFDIIPSISPEELEKEKEL
jgi:uncharacterized protein YycO